MATFRVGPSRTYTTINSAIAAAPGNDDLIFIDPGTYNENVTINKHVNLLGNTSTPENGDVYIYGGSATTLTINYAPSVREDIYIEGIKLSRSTVNWQVVFLISNSNSNLGIYLNRSMFIAGTNCYPVDINNKTLYGIYINNCYLERGFSHVLYANWDSITEGVISKTETNNAYYCYLCTGSPDTLDTVATPTADYGPSYGSYYKSYTPPTPPDVSSWANKIILTIDNTNVDEDLTDFPVLVTLSSGTGQNTYDATPVFDELISISGTKNIAITDSDDNVLFTEIERWDWDNEEANLWVKVPFISSVSGTVLYLYYDATVSGNTDYVGDTGDEPAQEVWVNYFTGVWHMAQNPSGGTDSILDSTFYVNHGTPNGSMTSGDLVDGKIGKAIDFDGTDDYITLGDTGAVVFDSGSSVFTVSAWIKPTSLSASASNHGTKNVFIARASDTYNDNIELGVSETGYLQVYIDENVDDISKTYGNGEITTGSGVNISLSFDSGSLDMYINLNNYTGSFTGTSIDDAAGSPITFGNTEHSDIYFNGVIDEIRLSNVVREASWVKADYYNFNNNFITFSEVVAPPPLKTISGVANIWTVGDFIFKTVVSGIGVYDVSSEASLGIISYTPNYAGAVWANDDYLYISTINSGVLRSPMSSISVAVYNDLSVYKNYPDISSEWVNYVHGAGNYLNVATISGAHIFDLTTGSGVYSNTSISARKCHQLADRTSYYIYDNKALTIYNDDLYYMYQSGDGIIPTISGMNDIYVVSGTNNLILLATTDGAVVIEERKGDEENSRFKYYYIEE